MNFTDVQNAVSVLAAKVQSADFQPDYLVGLARGGWIPTRLLSKSLGVKELLSIGIKYADSSRIDLVAYSLPNPMPSGKKMLLIEDCMESGKSLLAARNILEAAGNIVMTASIYVTDKTLRNPDFFVQHLPIPPSFPWE